MKKIMNFVKKTTKNDNLILEWLTGSLKFKNYYDVHQKRIKIIIQ